MQILLNIYHPKSTVHRIQNVNSLMKYTVHLPNSYLFMLSFKAVNVQRRTNELLYFYEMGRKGPPQVKCQLLISCNEFPTFF